MEDVQVLAQTSSVFSLLIAFLILCFKAGEWKGSVGRDRQSFYRCMNETREKIDDILDRLPIRRLLKEQNPLGLTDFGREVGEEIGANEWAANIVTNLRSEVERKSPY